MNEMVLKGLVAARPETSRIGDSCENSILCIRANGIEGRI